MRSARGCLETAQAKGQDLIAEQPGRHDAHPAAAPPEVLRPANHWCKIVVSLSYTFESEGGSYR